MPASVTAQSFGSRELFDPRTGRSHPVPLYWRFDLAPGAEMVGPAIIAEDETSTLVPAGFTARINALGYIVMTRQNNAK